MSRGSSAQFAQTGKGTFVSLVVFGDWEFGMLASQDGLASFHMEIVPDLILQVPFKRLPIVNIISCYYT